MVLKKYRERKMTNKFLEQQLPDLTKKDRFKRLRSRVKSVAKERGRIAGGNIVKMYKKRPVTSENRQQAYKRVRKSLMKAAKRKKRKTNQNYGLPWDVP